MKAKIVIKFWNYGRGDRSIKKSWDDLGKFQEWLFSEESDKSEQIKGKFSIKINGGYGKTPKMEYPQSFVLTAQNLRCIV